MINDYVYGYLICS